MSVVHEGHVCRGGWLLVVRGGDVAQDVAQVPEVAQRGHPVDPCLGTVGGGAGCGVGHVGLVVAAVALGVRPPRLGLSDKLPPQSMGGIQTRSPAGDGLLLSGVSSGGRSCRAMRREASKRKSRTPSPRVAAWTRVAAWMPRVVPEVRRGSTSWSLRPRRCCPIDSGLWRV